ncbi:MAG: hypothetical protein R3C11_27635 [Planctomycetaceae bacterium]
MRRTLKSYQQLLLYARTDQFKDWKMIRFRYGVNFDARTEDGIRELGNRRLDPDRDAMDVTRRYSIRTRLNILWHDFEDADLKRGFCQIRHLALVDPRYVDEYIATAKDNATRGKVFDLKTEDDLDKDRDLARFILVQNHYNYPIEWLEGDLYMLSIIMNNMVRMRFQEFGFFKLKTTESPSTQVVA